MLFTVPVFSELQHGLHFSSSNWHLGGVFKALSYTEFRDTIALNSTFPQPAWL